MPKVDVLESQILTGLTFNVLEGIYSLDANSFEAQEANKEGWAHHAEKVKTEEDVIEFIKKHGGTFSSAPKGTPYEYIIGGSTGDARVKTLINGLEYAKSVKDSKKKADQKLAPLAQHDGIIKWTFVYSLVHRIQGEGGTRPAKDSHDQYLVPEPHHYLAKVARKSLAEELFSLSRPLSTSEMELALTAPNEQNRPWQFSVDLKEEERWVLSSRFTPLWPYYNVDDLVGETRRESSSITIYPDVFSSFGFSSEKDAADEIVTGVKSARWNNVDANSEAIMSVVPLVSVMGGLITPHLHSGVTHIICPLKEGTELSYEEGVTSLHIFACQERGQYLLDYLNGELLFEKSTIKLVSTDWVRNKLKYV